MKFITILIIIILLALGGWYFFNMSEPVEQTEENGASVEESMNEEEINEENNSASGGETMNAEIFDVVGSHFSFDVKEIRVKKGAMVTINFSTTEGLHDWRLDEFDAATERVGAGEKTSVTFVADKAGTFEYYCSVGSHRAQGMVGTLVVEE